MTYLSLTWSYNPEGRFSYDAAQMCQKGYKRWSKIYIANKETNKQTKKTTTNDHNEEQINEVGKVTEI